MGHDAGCERLTPEEAKARLLDPPVGPQRPSWLSQNAPWLCLVAGVAGFAVARPIRVGRMTGKAAGLAVALARSPMVRTVAMSYATSLWGRAGKRNGNISFHS